MNLQIEWIKGLTPLTPYCERCKDELLWITKKGFIRITLFKDDLFLCEYSYGRNPINKIEGNVDSMKTYHLNKTLKQLFISLEE